MSLVADAQLADLHFQGIPVIDLSEISKPRDLQSVSSRTQLLAQIRDACIRVGFFYIRNHGVSEAVIARAFEAMKEFFSRPMEKKMEFTVARLSDDLPVNGFTPLPKERSTMTHEAFGFEFKSSPRWPASPDMQELGTSALGYRQAVFSLGNQLYELFAESLKLPPNYFKDKTKEGVSLWKALHYPPQVSNDTKSDGAEVLGIRAHTDWDCFTILWQQPGPQALQVKNPAGEWINAPALPGTLIVNVAENFTILTNGIYKSAAHRVINESGMDRYSMPVFFALDSNVMLEPIPSCVSPERPFKFKSVTAGEYLRRKLQAEYGSV